jgi:hypothetical protein
MKPCSNYFQSDDPLDIECVNCGCVELAHTYWQETKKETEMDQISQIEQKLDALIEAVELQNELFQEVLEKLSNLSLPGVDFDTFLDN